LVLTILFTILFTDRVAKRRGQTNITLIQHHKPQL